MAKNEILRTFSEENSKNAEEHYKIAPGKQEILQMKRKIVGVIENLLEKNISDQTLIEHCHFLSKSDYSDVIEERNIVHLCGYPLCSNHIKLSSQKFHIVCKVNKVYNITERKCFCSNKCYKASCYLKEQLSDVPVWFQESPITVKLLSDSENCGSSGDYIDLRPNTDAIKVGDINEKSETVDWFTSDDKNLTTDEMLNCITSRVSNLEIKERRNFSSVENNSNDQVLKSPASSATDFTIKSIVDDIDLDDSEEDDIVSEERQLFEKFMPVPAKSKINRPILVEPHLHAHFKRSSAPISRQSIHNLLKEWMTDATLAFLANNKTEAYLPNQFDEIISNAPNDCSKSDMHESPVVLPEMEINERLSEDHDQAIHSQESSDQSQINFDMERVKLFFQGEDLRPHRKEQTKNVKFKMGKNKNIKIIQNKVLETKRKNSVQDEIMNAEDARKLESEALEKLVLPNIDSLSQNALRQQVVCSQLKNAFISILPFIGAHYRVLCTLIPELVATFRLTATNIVFKPTEWKLIAIVVLRIISKSGELKSKIPEQFTNDDIFCTLLMKTGFSKDFSLPEIDQILQNFV